MNDQEKFPIPAKTNLGIAALQIASMLAIFHTAATVAWPWLLLLGTTYALIMNSAYAMLHEAEHGLLHPRRPVNEGVGVVLALFFPAPFHLLRQGHIGHHLRNRSDDEAFDFYFEGESKIWKHLQLYGILTGLFWFVIVLGNAIAALHPKLLTARFAAWDRPTRALLESLNPRYMRAIRVESIAVFAFHALLIWMWEIPVWRHLAILTSFGILWSALQYVHHFGTVRDVKFGARNLRTWSLIDRLWLNHNWHLNHHIEPTVPWIYLPQVEAAGKHGEEPRRRILRSYLRMWRGPALTEERIENRYAGKIIR